MSTDLALFIGIVLGVLTVPAILSAIMDGSAPRVAAFTAVVSGGLIVYAVSNRAQGYTIDDLPRVFSDVLSGVVF